MNRRHSADEYRRSVDRLRTVRPDIAMASDFIVGFPEESDADFAETMRLARDIGYAQAYSFKYSARPGTPAAGKRFGHIAEDVKTARLAELQQLLDAQLSSFNRACEGRTMPVLFERHGRKPGKLVGRSPYMQIGRATCRERRC